VFVDQSVVKENMLYKFKSKVTGDLIMLEPDAKRLLKIMGREEQVKGIFLADQLTVAIAALESAVAEEEVAGVQDPKQISLRQRCSPMLKMLKQCHNQSVDVVWGV
jgi:DNA polymerase III sliding clamp (beta) subunit (PCNA family)